MLTSSQSEQVAALYPKVLKWAGRDEERRGLYTQWLCAVVPLWEGQCELDAFVGVELRRRWYEHRRSARRPLPTSEQEATARPVDADAEIDQRQQLAALDANDRAVADCLRMGHSVAATARTLGRALYQVQQSLKRIKRCLSP